MKRTIAISALAIAVALGAYSQQTLDGFKSGFTGFAGDLAGSLSLNSSIGSNWSDAYVGGFPHFGVGIATGAAFVNSDSSKSLFSAVGVSIPSAFSSVGIPIPAAVATFKIGIPFLPIDVGVKGGYLPPSLEKSLLGSSGASADYTNVGVQIRYAVIKQNLLLPNVSIGASYNYQKGGLTYPTGISGQTFTVPTGASSTATISATSPEMALGWTSNTVDFTAQVSKKLLFLVPYAGAGLTVGKSSVTGGVNSAVTTDYPGGIAALNQYFAANGGPTIDSAGFVYTVDNTTPLFRVYGGLSLRIIVLDLDVQAMYVPASKALGGSLTARVQL